MATRTQEPFVYLQEYKVIVCTECQFAVWPQLIDNHLKGKHHGIRNSVIRNHIVREVQRWGAISRPDQLAIPSYLGQPMPFLAIHDGLLCQLDPNNCQSAWRTPESLKCHWKTEHGWNLTGKHQVGGHYSARDINEASEAMRQTSKQVKCQRLFPSRHGSQFIPILDTMSAQQPDQTIEMSTQWANLADKAQAELRRTQENNHSLIQEGQKNDVNPWLQRAGWVKYLHGCDRNDLRDLIREPKLHPNEPIDALTSAIEAPASAVWAAVHQVCRVSQNTTAEAGYGVRLVANKTQPHQDQSKPLETYWVSSTIKAAASKWQQLLVFFVRTYHAQRNLGLEERKLPEYRFTQSQAQAFKAMMALATITSPAEPCEPGADTTDLSNLESACLDFCVELLNQRYHSSEADCALICALAVLGLDDYGWRGPMGYTPILSAVIKCSRFMVIQKASMMSEAHLDDRGYVRGRTLDLQALVSGLGALRHTKSARLHHGTSCIDLVEQMMDAFMVSGTRGAMEWMMDLRRYGRAISTTTTAPGNVEWIHGDELLYKKLQFNMGQFRGFIQGVVGRAKHLLMTELMFLDSTECSPDGVPAVPWRSIYDNPADTTPGFNFLKDSRTRMPVDGSGWLFARVAQSPELQSMFIRRPPAGGAPKDGSSFDREAVRKYMATVCRFRELLLLSMTICGGQPARGPEILSVKHCNSPEGLRNIFCEDGMVVFATQYHKGYAITGKTKVIHRYLPLEVGELVVWYMWLVLPFQQALESLVYGISSDAAQLWPRDPDGKAWTSERLTRVMKVESCAAMGCEIGISDYRDIAIAISRRFLRPKSAFMDEDEAGKDADEDENDTWDLLAGHTTTIAEDIYARSIGEMAGGTAALRFKFRQACMDWHRFLCFQPSLMAATEASQAQFQGLLAAKRRETRKKLLRVSFSRHLQLMMGPDVRPRSNQEASLQAIASGASPVVSVMPTGSGKSMLFMLPAWVAPETTTVVVVPLAALRRDLIDRCKACGISCAAWNSSYPPAGAAIVIATVESAVSDAFRLFLTRLRLAGRLERIVIDECHVLLTQQGRFRPKVAQLRSLLAMEVQMVLLTATLPPSRASELCGNMGWKQDEMMLLRVATSRPNVAYSVHPLPRTSAEDFNRRTAELASSHTGKVVVYCNTKRKVQQLAALGGTDCECFHAGMSEAAKTALLDRFRSGKTRIVIATSALGMGVDIPDIRAVIHADEPRNLLDMGQESGRAGRDGHPSQSIVITGQQASKDGLVRDYLTQGRCRRRVLDSYLDGDTSRMACRASEQACDSCSRAKEARAVQMNTREPSSGLDEDCGDQDDDDDDDDDDDEADGIGLRMANYRRREADRAEQEARDVSRLGQLLEEWKNVCLPCRVRGKPFRHVVTQCQTARASGASSFVEKVRNMIKLEPYAGCMKCWVPQVVCNRWSEVEEGVWAKNDRPCQFYGVVTSTVLSVKHGAPELYDRWLDRLQGLGVEDVVQWLGSRAARGPFEGNQMVWEFQWLTGEISSVVEDSGASYEVLMP